MEEVVKKEKVEGNRKMAVEATIVRIMKTHKTRLHTTLVGDVC